MSHFQSLAAHLKTLTSNGTQAVVSELPLAAPLFSAVLPHDQAILLLARDPAAADKLVNHLQIWQQLFAQSRPVYLFPDTSIHEKTPATLQQQAKQSLCLHLLAANQPAIIVACVASLRLQFPSPELFTSHTIRLQVGQEIDMDTLCDQLIALDYDNELEVHSPGQFSKRGGLIDLFSPALSEPARLDFFGDQIDEIRLFDPQTQRTLTTCSHLEIIWGAPELIGGETNLLSYAANRIALYEPESCPLFLPESISQPQFASITQEAQFLVHGEGSAATTIRPSLFSLNTKTEQSDYSPFTFKEVCDRMARWDKQYTQVICVKNDNEANYYREKFQNFLPAPVIKRLHFIQSPLHPGLYSPEVGLAVYTSSELKVQDHPVSELPLAPTNDYDHDWQVNEELEILKGDYVVHPRYGIAEFKGLSQIDQGDDHVEVLTLEFADEVQMHVPLTQAHLVSRYIGQGKATPKLSKIGSKKWGNALEAAEEGIREFAAELLRLQAVRHTVPGQAMTFDAQLDDTFAATFPFTETPDQLKAIQEVCADLGRNTPMDRLLCGDVGYGKTEVAIRAAFTTMMNSFQVAVITPTTILTEQHYQSFSERLSDFPVQVEVLSRFRTTRQQKTTLAGLADGTVDLVVGTHRLLQKDIKFANLGLIIIDEEQKFGVKHKEFLKELRVSVHILTMSATPIPRTLHLSLTGARDLSTINTPPRTRLPVTTIVSESDETLYQEAIRRELRREGQVFILHNRVRTIAEFTEKIQQLVPEARIVYGHGQMQPAELEDIMHQFIHHKVDVIVSTTIIENGVDVPNANTIIIDRAERFGLAELYQLRGRVGRSYRQAYCYLFTPHRSLITGNARQRLAAIKQYTQLGAGFKLALKDLEIRGAGNILGSSQSGHIGHIGFDLYCEMLSDTVHRLKKLPPTHRNPKDHCAIRLPFLRFRIPPRRTDGHLSAHIPTHYINAEPLRLDCYKRIARCRDLEKLDQLTAEFEDRFGRLPESVSHLFTLARLEIMALARGIHAISYLEDQRLILELSHGSFKEKGRIPRLKSGSSESLLEQIFHLIGQIPVIQQRN